MGIELVGGKDANAARELDAEIRALVQRGEVNLAAQRLVARYGNEIASFLVARLRDVDDGRDAYGTFAEDLLRGLSGFEFRCSVRVWAYTIARNAANRTAMGKHRLRKARVSEHPSVLELAATARRSTAHHLRTDTKNRVRALRHRLELEDQTILMLHVDRDMSFAELAVIVGGPDLAADQVQREAMRLRKRFQRIKEQLRRFAIEEGIILP